MSPSVPDSVQALLDIGILQGASQEDAPSFLSTNTVNKITASGPGSTTGSVRPGFLSSSSNIPLAAKQQPPLFWKAIGFCLKNKFTSSGSLSDDNRVLFFGDPGQQGVLEGICPDEVTNHQLFTYGDTMQRPNFPVFKLEGNSYFDFLNLYLKNVKQENESQELVQARQALVKATREKNKIWEECRASFSDDHPTGHLHKQESLIGYIDNSKNYHSAWEKEEKAEKEFIDLRDPALSSVSAKLDMIRLADMRLQPQVGNNMPVIAVDEDWLQMAMRDPKYGTSNLVDPKTIYYRPLYSLPSYEITADYWIKCNTASGQILRDGPYQIPLAGIWDRMWSDLGHPLLDEAKPYERLSNDQKDFINSLSATLTFLQKPFAGNVNRGLWDATDLRGNFELQPNAPQNIEEPVCKTSKLIMAWGLEIELIIPDTVSVNTIKNVTLAAMDLPLKQVMGNGNKLVFSAGGDGFPVLVGALADLV